MDRDRIESWCQKGMLAVVIAAMGFAAIAFGGVDLWTRMVLLWLLVLGFGLFAIRLIVVRKPRLLLPPALWAATLFMAYAFGRYWYADVEYVARQELIRVGICYGVFCLVVTSLNGQRAVKALAYAMILLATLEAAYGIYQWAAKPGTVLGVLQNAQFVARGSGTLFNPNHLAGLVGLALPITVAVAFVSREAHWIRILAAYCAGVQAVGVLATLSRGGLVATFLAVSFLGVFLIWKLRNRWAVLVGAVLVLVVGLAVWQMPEQLKKRFSEARKQVTPDGRNNRELIWAAAVGVWKEEPWFGAGPDHFDQNFRKHRDLWLQTRPRRAHNDYLQLLSDWGAVGAMAVVIFSLALAWGLVRAWPHLSREPSTIGQSSNSTRFACVVGAMFGILAGMVHCVVEFNLFIPAFGVLLAVALGILAAAARYGSDAGARAMGAMGRGIGLVALAVGLGVLIPTAVKGSAEAMHLGRAGMNPFGSPENEESLGNAIKSEPNNPETHYLLGEILRMRSFDGLEGYEGDALKAISHFETAISLTPADPFPMARKAMCLDWLDRKAEAGDVMGKALALDPNNKSIVTLMGWHYLQAGQLAKAREQLDRAHNRIPHERDPLSGVLLERVDSLLASPLRQAVERAGN